MQNLFSEVKVYPNKNNHQTILANGSFVVGGAVKVKFTYIKGANGPFVSLPQEKGSDGKYYPRANFINKEAVAAVNQMVKEVYDAGGTQSNFDNSGGSNQASPASTQDDGLPF